MIAQEETGTVPDDEETGTVPDDDGCSTQGDSPRVGGCEMTSFFFGVGCKIERRFHPKEGLNRLFSPIFSNLGADRTPEALKTLQKILAHSPTPRLDLPQDYLPARLRSNPPGTIPFANSRLIVDVPQITLLAINNQAIRKGAHPSSLGPTPECDASVDYSTESSPLSSNPLASGSLHVR